MDRAIIILLGSAILLILTAFIYNFNKVWKYDNYKVYGGLVGHTLEVKEVVVGTNMQAIYKALHYYDDSDVFTIFGQHPGFLKFVKRDAKLHRPIERDDGSLVKSVLEPSDSDWIYYGTNTIEDE